MSHPRELVERLRALADFIERNVSGQRYGKFGAPYVNMAPIREAIEFIEDSMNDTRVLALLKRIEWYGWNISPACPSCLRRRPFSGPESSHEPDCELKALMDELS